MHQPTEPVPRFYKLLTGEDIVAYELEDAGNYVRIKQPMAILIENHFESARQMLNVREWIPPIVTKGDELNLPKKLIMFSMDTNVEFRQEFASVVAYFYGVQSKRKKPKKEGGSDKKVVPFLVKDESGKSH